MKQSLISEEYIPNTVSTPLDNGVWGTTQHDGRTTPSATVLTHTYYYTGNGSHCPDLPTPKAQAPGISVAAVVKVRPGILLEVESQWQPKLLMVYTAG